MLQEADGVTSLIRVIDRFTITARAPVGLVPEELPETQFTTTFVVMLKSGDARGRHPVSVTIEQPSGQSLPPQSVDMMFEGDDRGINLILNIVTPAIEGLYWLRRRGGGRGDLGRRDDLDLQSQRGSRPESIAHVRLHLRGPVSTPERDGTHCSCRHALFHSLRR